VPMSGNQRSANSGTSTALNDERPGRRRGLLSDLRTVGSAQGSTRLDQLRPLAHAGHSLGTGAAALATGAPDTNSQAARIAEPHRRYFSRRRRMTLRQFCTYRSHRRGTARRACPPARRRRGAECLRQESRVVVTSRSSRRPQNTGRDCSSRSASAGTGSRGTGAARAT
jgi:hypothetical protein